LKREREKLQQSKPTLDIDNSSAATIAYNMHHIISRDIRWKDEDEKK